MNKKKFADFVFLVTGSFIILVMTIIVTVNFFKDGKIFEKPVIAAVDEKTGNSDSKTTENNKDVIVQPDNSDKTFVYRRPYDPPKPVQDFGESIPKPTQTPLIDYGEGIPPAMNAEKAATPAPTPTSTPTITITGVPKQQGNSDATVKDSTPKPSETPGTPATTDKIKVEVISYSSSKDIVEIVRAKLEAAGYEVSAGNAPPTTKAVKSEIIERNDKKAGSEVKKVVNAGTISKQPDPSSRFDVTVIIGDDFTN